MEIPTLLKSIPYLIAASCDRLWIDYDHDADVLYISFRKPQNANDSVLEENIIYHYHDETLVGLTVSNAAAFFGKLPT